MRLEFIDSHEVCAVVRYDQIGEREPGELAGAAILRSGERVDLLPEELENLLQTLKRTQPQPPIGYCVDDDDAEAKIHQLRMRELRQLATERRLRVARQLDRISEAALQELPETMIMLRSLPPSSSWVDLFQVGLSYAAAIAGHLGIDTGEQHLEHDVGDFDRGGDAVPEAAAEQHKPMAHEELIALRKRYLALSPGDQGHFLHALNVAVAPATHQELVELGIIEPEPAPEPPPLAVMLAEAEAEEASPAPAPPPVKRQRRAAAEAAKDAEANRGEAG